MASVEKKIEKWPRGRCEFWTSDRTMCGKDGRWLVDGEIRCGEHRPDTEPIAQSRSKSRPYKAARPDYDPRVDYPERYRDGPI